MQNTTTFAALQEKFLTRLPLRIEQLDQQLLAAEKDPLDTAILDEVLRGFHSLAGIGGTYGFPTITDRARRAEHVCAAVLGERRGIGEREISELRNDLQFLNIVHASAARTFAAAA